jgi:transposase
MVDWRSTTTSRSVLRGVAVGRRSWLFAGSRAGDESAAAIYTVIQTSAFAGAGFAG